jgi:outer membrane receptor for monomeric catechols
VLKPGKTHRATFSLTATAQALPTVAVADTANKSHWLDQFERRRSGSRGTFLTRADIDKRSARSGTDVIRTVPGVRLVAMRGGAGYQVLMTRGAGARACVPNMFVHGMPYSGMLDDFNADDIEALEIYVGISEIPPELDKNGRGICGAIVVWTRDPRRRDP